MDIRKIEEFFNAKLKEEQDAVVKGSMRSFTTNTKGVKLHFLVLKDNNYIKIMLDPDIPDQAFPLCEYEVQCDNFIITEATEVGPVLMFEYQGIKNSRIAITKTSEGFSLSVGV